MTNNNRTHLIFNGNVIDIEASGLGSNSYPIEIGIVLNNGKTYETLIAPSSHWTHWDDDAEKLHGITRHQLLRQGKPAKLVCLELNNLCYGKRLYSDCWVYDSAWLNTLYGQAGIAMTFSCTPIESILSEEQLKSWPSFKKDYIQHSGITPHRALNDAVIISEILERCAMSDNDEVYNPNGGKKSAGVKQGSVKQRVA